MRKFLFYVIFAVVWGVVFGLATKITNLPDHLWSYVFAAGFIFIVFCELFGLLYKKLFPGEKMFGRKIH